MRKAGENSLEMEIYETPALCFRPMAILENLARAQARGLENCLICKIGRLRNLGVQKYRNPGLRDWRTMSAELIINSNPFETRVALVENGQVAELHVERSSDRGIAGNIYKGRVVRVLPGMQAAFVDIGLDKAAFLVRQRYSSAIMRNRAAFCLNVGNVKPRRPNRMR